jgi:oligopeptide/dipeptide ABC transporter ATP-binding protein
MRLLPANAMRIGGSVRLNGVDVDAMPDEQFRREVRWQRIAMVFQGAMNALNPVLRVGRQVAERPIYDGESERAALAGADRLFELVGLPAGTGRRYPHELSGGMKQRVAIAMALALQPDLVILDEPTSALDVSIQAQIMNLLKRLKRDLGLAMIFISHDIALASDISDRIAVVYGGQVRELGTADDVLNSPLDPYTQALLGTVARLNAPEPPAGLPGTPPDATAPPSGCRFHPRCAYVYEPCADHEPAMFEPRPTRLVRCWLHSRDGGDGGEPR